MRAATDRQHYPLLQAFGTNVEFLSPEEADAAPFGERLRSVWLFLVRRVMKFQATLSAREKANFDPEDVAAELWVALAERDGRWSPDRGRYITFAGVIIDRRLCAIRDKARTVESPRNSSCRLKEYAAEERDGTISDRRRKSANDIRRTAGAIGAVEEERPECVSRGSETRSSR